MTKNEAQRGVITAGDIEAVAELIGTTGDPIAEIVLRFMLTQIPEQMQAFVKTEGSAGRNGLDVTLALHRVFLSFFASIHAVAPPDEEMDRLFVDLIVKTTKAQLPPLIKETRKRLQEIRREGMKS